MKDDKTIRQLKKEAMLLRIKGYYNMTKSELAEVISRQKMELSKKIRELESMEIDELRSISKELGLKIPWKSTKKTFVKKIRENSEKLKLIEDNEELKPEKVNFSSKIISSHETQKIITAEKSNEPVRTLPQTYFKDKLVGLEVNQNWIHFYWDLSPKSLEIVKEHPHLALRVYDVTYIEFNGANAHRTFEMQLDDKTRKYFVFVPQAGADYVAEIGYEEKGRFVPLLRSNLVSTPPSTPRTAQMELWMDLRLKRKFTEMSPAKRVLRIEKLIGFGSLPTSAFKSGGGAFFVLSGRRSS